MQNDVLPGTAVNSAVASFDGRIDLACGGFASGARIASAVGASENSPLITLRITPAAGKPARSAVLEARSILAKTAERVRVLVEIPNEADGTTAYRSGSTDIRQILDLTNDLSAVGADLCWALPLSTQSVWMLDSLFSLAQDNNIPALILPPREPLRPDAQLFAWDFITYFLLDEIRSTLGPKTVAYYEALQEALYEYRLGEKPDPATLNALGGTLLSDALAENGSEAETAGTSTLNEVVQLAGEGLRAYLSAAPSMMRRKTPLPSQIESALLVGAYGGEHIGDMGILGGVLFRLHREFGLKEAMLLTQRPNHTRHLVDMLDTPVTVSVAEYTFDEIDQQLKSRNALVHAGGPLTDIPKQLVRHLYAAGQAKKSGKPYLMEGVGPTTFKRAPSRITARQLVRLADRLRIRTKDDAGRPVIQGLDFEIGHDPAFDYLETRGAELTRLLPHEPAEIDALLAETEGRPLIGINIRPINDLFTPETPGKDRAEFTREVEDQMERNLAAGLARFAEESDKPPVFVFFPMNAIQFGKSDNRSAYRIARHLPSSVDARVWHSDASLDAVVALIRKLDTIISMRFHATIFALSQNCLPIGVDYRIGQKYKVTAVMEDAEQEDFCCRIDTVDPEWIAARLHDRVCARGGS